MARRTLEQKLLPLAERFAAQIARIVEKDTRRAVATEVRQRLRTIRSSSPASSKARAAAKKIVVECPFPGCNKQGVRTLSNFCVEHNRSLSATDKKKYREAQRQAKAQALSKGGQSGTEKRRGRGGRGASASANGGKQG